MSVATRLGAYLAGLVLVVGVGFLIGGHTALGELASSSAEEAPSMSHSETTAETTAGTVGVPGGLQATQDGYSLQMRATGYAPGRNPVELTIVGPDGEPVRDYEETHEKRLHLIAVRTDFAGFQHVHPSFDTASGEWSVELDLAPGTWRVFADLKPTGADAVTLGTNLLVSGDPGAQTFPQPTRTDTVDGYDVTVTGDLGSDELSALHFEISKDGEPVTTLQPYLGASGHLVALREADLAYLHVHPHEDEGGSAGPEIAFSAEVPSAGRYHLFLDFKVDGRVHTAAFTLDGSAGHASPSDGGDGDHGH